MEIFDTPRFFRTISLPTRLLLWEKSDTHSFWRILEKQNPSLPFIREGANYGSRVKMSENNANFKETSSISKALKYHIK